MTTTAKKILEIRYSSTKNFVFQNGLELQANELFGEDWENENDCNQIEELINFINADFYEVEFIEGLQGEEDIKVWFNSSEEKLHQAENDKKELLTMLKSFTELFAGDFQERKRQGVNSLYNQANLLISKFE